MNVITDRHRQYRHTDPTASLELTNGSIVIVISRVNCDVSVQYAPREMPADRSDWSVAPDSLSRAHATHELPTGCRASNFGLFDVTIREKF